VFSLTYPLFHTWQSQFVIAAIVGLIVTALCFLFLRDLSPQLRAQVIDTARESQAVEAHAKDVDIEAAMRNPWRQVLRPRIIFSVIGFSVSLIIYFAAQNYFPTYLNLVLKFSLPQADGLVSFFFFMSIAFAILAGIASDLALVRKPFLLAGAIVAIVGVVLFISRMGQPPDVFLMGVILLLITAGISIYNVPWLAAYTETIEDINPALVGTGMALYGFFIRVVVVASTLGFSFVVATHGNWLAWWWVSIAGLVVFLPVSLTVAGYWTRGQARAAIRAHEAAEGLTPSSGRV
jgi:sugar phosphate permease